MSTPTESAADAGQPLDDASAMRLLELIVGYEEANLGRGLYDCEVTWAIGQETAIVSDVRDLLDALVAAGRLTLTSGLYRRASHRSTG